MICLFCIHEELSHYGYFSHLFLITVIYDWVLINFSCLEPTYILNRSLQSRPNTFTLVEVARGNTLVATSFN